MSLVYGDSSEGVSSRLMIFDLPPTEVGIQKIQDVEYRPIAQITNNSPIEYSIPASGSFYKDLRNMTQKMKIQILHADGTPLVKDEKIGFINQILQSVWKNVDIYLEGHLMTSSDTNYAYRSMFQTLLNYGYEAKMSQLQSEMFYKDSAGGMDANDPTGGGNTGLFARYKLTNESSVVQLEGPLMTDLNYLDRLLINGVRIGMKFTPNNDSFCLMTSVADTVYKVKIIEHCLKIPHIHVSGGVLVAHDKMLQSVHAKYPLKRTEVKAMSIPQGTINFNELLFQDQIPSRVVIGFVRSEAYNGSYSYNPFNFHHYLVNFLRLSVNGDAVSGHPLQLKFGDSKNYEYVEPYLNLYKATQKFGNDVGNDIQFAEYNSGYTLFVADMDPTLTMMGVDSCFRPDKRGQLRLEAKFDEALKHTINVICYAEFQCVFEIDRARNIIFDNSM